MLRVNIKKIRWFLIVSLFLSYTISVYAATALETRIFTAPFLFSWLGVWVFSAAGGLCASFVKITDIDEKLNYPVLAKFVIGLFWGVALCSAIDALTSTPQAALTFFALFASCFSAPLCAGLMVYLSNQKRLNGAFDSVAKRTGNRYLGEDSEGKK